MSGREYGPQGCLENGCGSGCGCLLVAFLAAGALLRLCRPNTRKS